MKKLLIILLLVFGGTSIAWGQAHHRAHATQKYAVKTIGKLRALTNTRIPNLRANPDWPQWQIVTTGPGKWYRNIYNRSITVTALIERAVDELNTPGSCSAFDANIAISKARRTLSQPAGGGTGATNSALYKMYEMHYHFGQMLRDTPAEQINYDAIKDYDKVLSEAWLFALFMLWHTNDAHLENVDNVAGAGHDPLVDPSGIVPQVNFDPCL